MAAKLAQAAESGAVSRIALERPASVRRLLPGWSDGWPLTEYLVGPENDGLNYLFAADLLSRLESVSPVLFYGDKHLGKTILAITLAVRWSRTTRQRPLHFTTGGGFASDFAAACEIDDVDSFRQRHRGCKMLVIDDLDGLASKPAAQDELSQTLDHLSNLDRPVIVTASRLPASLKGLKSSLSSRLSAGYSIGLRKPATATRDHIVRSLIAVIDPELSESEVLQVVGQLGASSLNAFELRDVVTVAHQNLSSNGQLDPAVVTLIAKQHLGGSAPTLPLIAKAVAKRTRVKLVDLRGSTRLANVVRARGLAILLARKLTSASLQAIGEYFGGRDHSTVLHAYRKTEQLLSTDSELANFYRDIQTDLVSG